MAKGKSVTVVVGMQYGSEAKGKLISVIAHEYQMLVRTGSVNAAHTVYFEGKAYPWHQLPAGTLHMMKRNPESIIVLGAGSQLDLHYLEREVKWLQEHGVLFFEGTKVPRLLIDNMATVIDEFDTFAENGYANVCGPQWYKPTTCQYHNGDKGPDGATKAKGGCTGCSLYPADSMHRTLGSTTHGSGMNMIRKLARRGNIVMGRENLTFEQFVEGMAIDQMLKDDIGPAIKGVMAQAYEIYGKRIALKAPPVKLVSDIKDTEIAGVKLGAFLADTVDAINTYIDAGKKVMLEGTQGAMLSVHHGTWPKTTSRDTNASNWCMEAGVAPTAVEKVIGVARTFPIRVAGDSGPTSGKEITWKDVSEFAGVPYTHNDDPTQIKGLIEITTATKRVRRVFEFGDEDFLKAMQLNRPDELMLTFVDYLGIENAGKRDWNELTPKAREWVIKKEASLGVHFRYLSTGPGDQELIVR